MSPLTLEWIDKAEGDFATLGREFRARISPNHDAACFHAQQCIEKYIKARLQEEAIPFGRTHNLGTLLDLIIPVEPTWATLRPSMILLTTYAVDMRYPGNSVGKLEAKEAYTKCVQIRAIIRASFGLV